MANERAEVLKKAEKLLRTGKLDLAIAEYVRLVEDQPRDWNTRNALGDLYVRANRPHEAVAQYTPIADHLSHEGFYPKASALYQKILKIKPDEESVQLHLGEISAKMGLLADAKAHFLDVAATRRNRGDLAGAAELTIRLGSLDPSDFDARGQAARALEQGGDGIGAAMIYRSMHADLTGNGRIPEAFGALREAVRLNPDDTEGRAELAKNALAEGDLELVRVYLDRAIAGDDPALMMAFAEIELGSGHLESGRELLGELIRKDDTLRPRITELAWTLASASPEAAYVCIDIVVEAELASGNYMDAAAMLQEFSTRVSSHIVALLKLVEVCLDGGLEATMYETQAQLADAYLELGQGAEARVIAEDLVAREPWEQAHIDRFRRAMVMLNVPDPDALIAERLSGQGPFVVTDPFMAPESFGEPEPEREPEPEPPVPVREPDPSPAPIEEPPAPPKKKQAGVDIDLNSMLSSLQTGTASTNVPQDLDEVDASRAQVSRQAGVKEAGEQLALAQTYLDMGMTDEAIASLTRAAKIPTHRFAAASLLGRLYLKKKDPASAVEWLERAAEAPAPTEDEGRELLYDLGATLDATGDVSRALAIFMELQSDAGEYKDVAERVDRLARVQTGG